MRIGSRGSALARAQAQQVCKLLGGAELVTIRTSGDGSGDGADPDERHSSGSDKSRWVDSIEQALLAGEIDLAVHSAKDVPGELLQGLTLLGSPRRAAVEDALCGVGGIGALPNAARVGTSSLRRTAQLLAARPDVEIAPLRGNVDTRLAKLADLGLDAIVLAHAGLGRLGREREVGALLDPIVFVPSPGQGALALQGRADDEDARRAAHAITDETTFTCLRAERALAQTLQATCNTPLGAWCRPVEDGGGGATRTRPADSTGLTVRLRAWVGLPNGEAWIADELHGSATEPERLADELARRMIAVGAGEMLAAAEAAAG